MSMPLGNRLTMKHGIYALEKPTWCAQSDRLEQPVAKQEPDHIYLHKDWNQPQTGYQSEVVSVERHSPDQTKYLRMDLYEAALLRGMMAEQELAEVKLDLVRTKRQLEATSIRLSHAYGTIPVITTLYGHNLDKILDIVTKYEKDQSA